MALFNRFKQILIPERKAQKKKYPTEEHDTGGQDISPADGKQLSVAQRNRQVRVTQLTPREYELYLLLLEGFTLKESAKQLSIKYSTANTHMTGIYKKLEVKSRAELIINYYSLNGGNNNE